jgi:hypothetical protein
MRVCNKRQQPPIILRQISYTIGSDVPCYHHQCLSQPQQALKIQLAGKAHTKPQEAIKVQAGVCQQRSPVVDQDCCCQEQVQVASQGAGPTGLPQA